MSLSRSFLRSLGLNDDQANAVIEQYAPVTDELKQLRDDNKAAIAKVSSLQKEVDALKSGEDFKGKYEAEHNAFETYKQQIAAEKETERVKAAYRKLLADEKIGEKHIGSILGITNFANMKLDESGNLNDVDTLKKTIADKYSDFKVVEGAQVYQPTTPPKVDNGGDSSTIRAMTAKWHEARYGKSSNQEKG